MENNFFNSSDIMRLIGKWRKHLMIIGLISLIASIIFSSPFFIKPKFKSFAVVYPSNLIAYSTESATEQMLQLAQSYDIRNRIIRTFRLFEHYGIDTAKSKTFLSEVYKRYDENIIIKKTEYESMEITVFDTDPIIASRIADSIVHFFDLKAREIQREKSMEVMVITQEQLENKKLEMDSMDSRLREFSKTYGLLDYKSQSKEVTRAFLRGATGSDKKAYGESEKMMSGLLEKGPEFNAISEHLWRVRGTYNDLKLEYDIAARDVYKKLTYANVVTKPFPSDKKASPVRWLIVVISVGSSLFLAFMLIVIFDSKNKV